MKRTPQQTKVHGPKVHGAVNPPPRNHAPRITLDPPRIIGCTCGWRPPQGAADSDDVYSWHVAGVQ